MKKIETIWCQLLYNGLEKRQLFFKQQDLAENLGMSLSTVNHGLKQLKRMGAVKLGGKGGEIINWEKILMYWANYRDLKKDIVWQKETDMEVFELENSLPDGSILGAYSAVRVMTQEAPADYDTVYVYQTKPKKVIERFKGLKGGKAKLVCLKWNSKLPKRKETTTLAHTFVDLWSLTDWMAKDFLDRVRKEMDELLSG